MPLVTTRVTVVVASVEFSSPGLRPPVRTTHGRQVSDESALSIYDRGPKVSCASLEAIHRSLNFLVKFSLCDKHDWIRS